MKTPIALSMLLSPFSLPHDERWVLPLALGLFALLAVFSAWWVLPLALGALLCAAHRHCVSVRAE